MGSRFRDCEPSHSLVQGQRGFVPKRRIDGIRAVACKSVDLVLCGVPALSQAQGIRMLPLRCAMEDGRFVPYLCAFCGRSNDAFVDPSGGALQTYTEDCSVCCHPNVLHIRIDLRTGDMNVDSEEEG